MIKIVGLPNEATKKFNIFGIDFSIAYAKLWQSHRLVPAERLGWVTFTKDIFYHKDSAKMYDTITYRLILWRLKFEVKTITRSSYAFS